MLKQNIRVPSHMRNQDRFRKTSGMTSFNDLNRTSSKELNIQGMTLNTSPSRNGSQLFDRDQMNQTVVHDKFSRSNAFG